MLSRGSVLFLTAAILSQFGCRSTGSDAEGSSTKDAEISHGNSAGSGGNVFEIPPIKVMPTEASKFSMPAVLYAALSLLVKNGSVGDAVHADESRRTIGPAANGEKFECNRIEAGYTCSIFTKSLKLTPLESEFSMAAILYKALDQLSQSSTDLNETIIVDGTKRTIRTTAHDELACDRITLGDFVPVIKHTCEFKFSNHID